MKTLFSKYDFGQILYLVTDLDQRPRIVTGVEFAGNGEVLYHVTASTEVSRHYEVELSEEINDNFRLGIEVSDNNRND